MTSGEYKEMGWEAVKKIFPARKKTTPQRRTEVVKRRNFRRV